MDHKGDQAIAQSVAQNQGEPARESILHGRKGDGQAFRKRGENAAVLKQGEAGAVLLLHKEKRTVFEGEFLRQVKLWALLLKIFRILHRRMCIS